MIPRRGCNQCQQIGVVGLFEQGAGPGIAQKITSFGQHDCGGQKAVPVNQNGVARLAGLGSLIDFGGVAGIVQALDGSWRRNRRGRRSSRRVEKSAEKVGVDKKNRWEGLKHIENHEAPLILAVARYCLC